MSWQKMRKWRSSIKLICRNFQKPPPGRRFLLVVLGNGVCVFLLCSSVQHIFDEDAVAHGGVIDQHMGHCPDEFSILDDGGATRPLPVAEEGRGASGSGLCATLPHRRQGAHRVPQQESRTPVCQYRTNIFWEKVMLVYCRILLL